MNNQYNTGLTLVEMLVYLAVFCLVFAILTGFIVWAYKGNAKFQAMTQARQNAEAVIKVISREARQAQSVYSPATSGGQLSLETTNYLSSGETSTYIDFFLCGSRLCLKKESLAPIALTSDKVEISNLTFTQISGPEGFTSLQISFTSAYQDTASIDANSTVALRNYQ